MLEIDLKGLIPATVLPQTEDYQIAEDDLRNYIQWLKEKEPAALAVNVDTGEGPHLYREEKKRIIEIYTQELKGEIPIIAGISASFTEQAVKLAKDAREAGADAGLVFPIPAYRGQPLDPELPFNYHRTLAEESGLPLILFQLQPALGGVEYTPEILEQLADIEQVIAIKEASFDALKFKKMVSRLKDKEITILSGNDNFILESMILGAEGALLGFATIAIEKQIAMLKAAKNQDYERAFALSEIVQPLADLIFSSPVRDYRSRLKEALKMLGVIENTYMRPPLSAIDDREKEKVRQGLQKAGLL